MTLSRREFVAIPAMAAGVALAAVAVAAIVAPVAAQPGTTAERFGVIELAAAWNWADEAAPVADR